MKKYQQLRRDLLEVRCDGIPATFAAAKVGNYELVHELWLLNARVSTTDAAGNTILHVISEVILNK